MAKKFEYKTILIKGRQNGIYAEFPFNVKQEFGTGKAVHIKATFDGRTYQMSLLPRGGGKHWIHVRKEIRNLIGKEEGDSVSVVIEKDDSERSVDIPDYLQWLFDNEPEMKKTFQKLSPFYKKYWIGTIEETKKEETKVERINRLFEFLIENQAK